MISKVSLTAAAAPDLTVCMQEYVVVTMRQYLKQSHKVSNDLKSLTYRSHSPGFDSVYAGKHSSDNAKISQTISQNLK